MLDVSIQMDAEFEQFLRANSVCVPNFPKRGVDFVDFSNLYCRIRELSFGMSWRIAKHFGFQQGSAFKLDAIVGLDSRGYILGTSLAFVYSCQFIPLRKASKTPNPSATAHFEKEYGEDSFSLAKHQEALRGKNVLIVDDLLATGGSVNAAVQLLKKVGANVVGAAVIGDIKFLRGIERAETGVYSAISL